MKLLGVILFAILVMPMAAQLGAAEGPVYELRTYYCAEGRVGELHQRFRERTMKLFEKHGMTSLGYWVRLDREGKKLDAVTYLLSFPSRAAREESWRAFVADPGFRAIAAEEASGKGPLIQRREEILLEATDYSPKAAMAKSEPARVFELRTYKTPPDRLDDLDARFRDHTLTLFSKHGMTNVGYFHPIEEKEGSKDTLIYLLAHKSREAAAASFDAFRQDADWVAARKASEEKAGGPLTVPNGVQSVFMEPTDYSPTR